MRFDIRSLGLVLAAAAMLACGSVRAQEEGAVIRVGIVGCDTSHAPAFAGILNDEGAANHVPGARVVAAFPGGSPDIPKSIDRVPGFVEKLKKGGVEIVDSVEKLVEKVDAVLLLSLDGRAHLPQAQKIFPSGKPVYIDKYLAASTKEGRAIMELARKCNTPVFCASSIRYADDVIKVKTDDKLGKILAVEASSPYHLVEFHPDLFFYGVHGVEPMYELMGMGCEEVQRIQGESHEVVVGRWKDGRIATWRGIKKGKSGYGLFVYTENATFGPGLMSTSSIYPNLVKEIVKFFQTRKSPVSLEESVEVLAFMEAADISKARNGAWVKLTEVK